MFNELSRYDDYIPDCLFPTDNQMEIPTLRLDVQPRLVEIPAYCFGEQKRTTNMYGHGILHFYTDDYRWQSVYKHPEKILKYNPGSIVEPNYSLFNETPMAFGLQGIYKKRWIGRQMQERGIGVFVDLNVANKFYAANLFGVPKGYGAFCTRGYSDRIPALEYEYMIAQRVADGNRMTFVVYGGGEDVKAWCRDHGCVYITPIVSIKSKLKAIERMKENVASFDNASLIESLPVKQFPTAKELYAKQVIDFNNQ
ncbi:MAG: DUF4417 domain-containing protein [Muribaculaceae bacterium]|jgi:hypothetical protein